MSTVLTLPPSTVDCCGRSVFDVDAVGSSVSTVGFSVGVVAGVVGLPPSTVDRCGRSMFDVDAVGSSVSKWVLRSELLLVWSGFRCQKWIVAEFRCSSLTRWVLRLKLLLIYL